MRALEIELPLPAEASLNDNSRPLTNSNNPIAFKSERECLPFPEMSIDFDEISELLENEE